MEFPLSEALNFLTLVVACYTTHQVSALRRAITNISSSLSNLKNEERSAENDLNTRLEELQSMRFSPLRIVPRNK